MNARIRNLDGVHGLAIIAVMIYHLRGMCVGDHPLLSLILGKMWCGVGLFFALSGFLITGRLIDEKGQTIGSEGIS